MKSKEQIEQFIKTLETLIPQLEVKKQEYLEQGNEFGFNIMKEKIKERVVELNTTQWVLDDSSNDKGVKDETTN